jgi:hypothetical protein
MLPGLPSKTFADTHHSCGFKPCCFCVPPCFVVTCNERQEEQCQLGIVGKRQQPIESPPERWYHGKSLASSQNTNIAPIQKKRVSRFLKLGTRRGLNGPVVIGWDKVGRREFLGTSSTTTTCSVDAGDVALHLAAKLRMVNSVSKIKEEPE